MNGIPRIFGLSLYWPLILVLWSTVGGVPAVELQATSVPRASLRAASDAMLPFVMQNGVAVGKVAPLTMDVPHLVLLRNGALTDADERTLILELSGIDVPPGGVTVTLAMETQHGDPDPGHKAEPLTLWRASQRIAGALGTTRTNVTVRFEHTFTQTISLDDGPITTPTDYVRYDLMVTNLDHPPVAPLYKSSADYAALLENQWIARLPEVREEAPGAAPDTLIVYYCDMFAFRKNAHDPETWLSRKEVTGYVGGELVPRMVEAFRVQTDEWGFPWYETWTSYRSEDLGRLSVALTDERTWFHGSAPSGGHSAISIRVKGGSNAPYATLTDGLVSTFHHELFHNLQRNLRLHAGDGRLQDVQDIWGFFSEGTAVLAESVGQPRGQFTQTLPSRTYISYANGYLWQSNAPTVGLNQHYTDLEPYKAALYWRFLFEQCARQNSGDGQEPTSEQNPDAGMQVVRRALVTLYSGEAVDPRSSADLVGALPAVMDRALAGSSCPFQTYRQSLTAFSRALYGLRLDGGKCLTPGTPAGCGFYDPHDQYLDPPLRTITHAGTDLVYRDGIKSSFGIDLIDVVLDPASYDKPFTLEFYGDPASPAEFDVQLVLLDDSRENAKPRILPDETGTIGVRIQEDGRRYYDIPAARATLSLRVGLIITRLDAQEAADSNAKYTIELRLGTDR